MGEKEDREKAEKLAAAKKRVAALQKKKKAAASGGGEKSHTKGKPSKDDTPKSPTKEAVEPVEEAKEDAVVEEPPEEQIEESRQPQREAEPDEDEAAFNAVIQSAGQQETPETDDEDQADAVSDNLTSTRSRPPGRQPSVSLQSKLRSTSFRDTAPGPASPNVSSLQRIEDLERENQKLADEASEHETRWRKTEEDLEELREEAANNSTSEIAKLRAEIEALRRQQRTNSGSGPAAGAKSSRRESMVSSSQSPDGIESLRKENESKDSTIADMQLEISRLRSQLNTQTSSCDEHGTQISSLTTSLTTTESKLRSLETELADSKKSLSRASEKAVLDDTERTSKETKIRSLERNFESANAQRDEVVKKASQLETKIEAMNKLHRETEARSSSKLSSAEQASREIPALRAKVSTLEAENARLRERHKRVMSGGGADEGLDELEDEERNKLARRIRELEGQVFELQRGVWRDKRIGLQPDMDPAASRKSLEAGEDFDEVDLSGGASSHASRRASSHLLQRGMSPATQQKHSNFSQYISSGLNAFLPSATSPPPGNGRPRNDSLLQEFDDDDNMFDEQAFAQAQREEEAKKMLEHVREVKRGLKNWKGWRLDLVDARRGEGGWEVFEI